MKDTARGARKLRGGKGLGPGVAAALPHFARTVTFESESDFGVQRMVDGRWHFRDGEVGTFALPVGSYRIVRGEQVLSTFEVLAGGHEVIKVPRFR